VTIERAAVVGAGVMGTGIAAHIANAGVPVVLLDLPADAPEPRSALARGAVERALRQTPPPFMASASAALVTPGNLEDDVGRLAGCDWIIEAVVEDLPAKHAVLSAIDGARTPGSIVSSNTSTIPLGELLAGAGPGLSEDLLVTHFFNPPRYLRLLELVAGPGTRRDAVETVTAFADRALGKVVVSCRDTPGFVANRLGGFWMTKCLAEAEARGIAVELADALVTAAFGCPRTGVFGLLDLIGLDVFLLVDGSLRGRLAADDPLVGLGGPHRLVERLVADGRIGRKGDGGFYRLERANGSTRRLALEVATGVYRPVEPPPELPGAADGPQALLWAAAGASGEFARDVVTATLAYAAYLVPEVSDSVAEIDLAMETGYGWRRGPFRLADALGPSFLAEQLEAIGSAVPPLLARAAESGGFYAAAAGEELELRPDGTRRRVARPAGVLALRDVRQSREPVLTSAGAALWDIGDGALCLELTTRLNAIDLTLLACVEQALDVATSDWRALVVYSDGERFSVGANVAHLLVLANTAAWDLLEELGRVGQDAFAALARAPVPVVGAPSGVAVGGGCELLLHCDAIQAHAETQVGLVEAGVGLVPGWGGCKELLSRLAEREPGGPMPPARAAFELIARRQVSGSAAEARELGFLRPTDRITANRDRLLADAKALALELADGYVAPAPRQLVLPGPSGRAALAQAARAAGLVGVAGEHDLVVADALARVLSGGDTDHTTPVAEAHVLELERQANASLLRTEETLRRLEHVLSKRR
jgi:3-hydroxyacyl-CoA dehydrogenase